LLFDGTKSFPEEAETVRIELLETLKEREAQLNKRMKSADIEAEMKAIEVGFGKMIEKFIPAYKNLDLEFTECRPLFDPIDLLVFEGLLEGNISHVSFLEVKSGNSKLNKHQKLIEEAILDKRVGLRVL
jgi:predicted Holliday junction resolvase-like endonuclease